MPTAIVDLSYLRASGRESVQNDLREYTVLLTFELIYEISTSSDGSDSCTYFKKLAGLNLAHSRALVNLLKEEVRTSERIEDVVHPNSKELIDAAISARGIGAVQEVRDFFERDEPQEFKNALERLWNEKHNGTFASCRSVDIVTGANKYLELFAPPEAKKVRGETIAKYYQMKDVPEPGWLIYDWHRLRNFLAFHYRLNGNHACHLGDKKLANDLADLTYLAFLSRVDAIATHDLTLIRPLAQVFGPPNLTIIQP